MGMMQIAVQYYIGQPPWLPDGQWCDLDKLAVTVVDVGFEARFAEWRRDLLLARPLTLKKRQQEAAGVASGEPRCAGALRQNTALSAKPPTT
jgi:hypothetical protein